jgi:hypothetical protein
MRTGLLLLFLAVPALAQHSILVADRTHKTIAIIDAAGKTVWQYECGHDVHDLHRLPNGNILTHDSHTRVIEINPKKEIVWSYTSKPRKEGSKVEVHAFERLADGSTMIAESGNSRIIEVNAKGEITTTIPLKVAKPSPHRDTRLVRKLPGGTYLVCHEAEGCVREYDAKAQVVWEYALPLAKPRAGGHGPEGYGNELYGAIRLASGNTLIAGGNNHTLTEVTAKGEVVWRLEPKDLPGITLAWITTVQALPNGNIVFGNCHAGPANPQLIEITREKKVVWTFKDFERFGNNLAASHVLVPGIVR